MALPEAPRRIARGAWPAVLAGAICLASLTGPAGAQTGAATAGDWSGQATLYGWLPVINGAQQGPSGRPLLDLDTADILSRLDMTFMGSLEIRRGRFGLLFDAVYVDLGHDSEWLQNQVSVSSGTKIGMYTLAGAYRVHDAGGSTADLYAGGRYFDTSLDFGIATDARGRSGSAELSWGSPIVGVRGAIDLSERWSLHGFADVGGFDGSSDLNWQMFGGASYAFSERWGAIMGYRYLSVLYQASDRAKLDLDIQGPAFGVSYRF